MIWVVTSRKAIYIENSLILTKLNVTFATTKHAHTLKPYSHKLSIVLVNLFSTAIIANIFVVLNSLSKNYYHLNAC